MCSSVALCVQTEIAASRGKKKAVDKNVTAILRKCVAAAEERRKIAGLANPLLRRAGKLFTHVYEVLCSGPPEFASDYANLLRSHLLPVSDYCARAKSSTYEGLITHFKDRLEESFEGNDAAGGASSGRAGGGGGGGRLMMKDERKDERYRNASTMLHLLRACPFDLSPNFAPILADFCASTLGKGRRVGCGVGGKKKFARTM